jgi:TonB family protein
VTPEVVATYTGTLHEQISASCELISPVKLIQYKQYYALASAGETDEIYSPELRSGDFVALSTTVPKVVTKSVKKAGFDLRGEPTDPSALSTKPTTNGSSCPNSQQAIADGNNRRREQRMKVQAHLHRVGFDVLPPMPIEQVQSVAIPNQAGQSSGKPKVKGTALLAMTVGISGEVQDVQVVRSPDVTLDQKAIEAVKKWKFSPARKNGLSVPVQINVEVNFQLY